MAESRAQMNKQYGNMITYHDEYNETEQKVRQNNTFQSNISFNDPTSGMGDRKQAQARQRQFQANPVQPGATRQSYQGSDIFGTQGNSEMVQQSAQAQKDFRQRESRTFARSDVMGTDVAALKQGEGGLHQAISTRQEQKWSSNIFAEPEPNRLTRKNMEPSGVGKGGLWGETGGMADDVDQWQRKMPIAAVISQRESTRPVQFDQSGADERKNRELYGNSQYAPGKKGDGGLMTSGADWRNPQQSYTNKKDKVDAGLGAPYERDMERKNRKAAQLQSNVLTHEDDTMRDERTKAYDQTGESRVPGIASNATWSAQTGNSKPINAGAVDAYRMRQNQLGSSNVLEQTDYSSFAPLQKKKVDMDNMQYQASGYAHGSPAKKPSDAIGASSGNWLAGGGGGRVNNDPAKYDAGSKKQGYLSSALDQHGYFPESSPKKGQYNNDEYNEKTKYTIPSAKSNPQKVKLMNQTSNILGHDAQRYYDQSNLQRGEVLDFDLRCLPTSCDEISVKKAANVKHVISSVVAVDNLTGQCTGTGRLKIRLSEGETEQEVKASLAKAGFWVAEHKENPSKNTGFSGPPKDDGKPKNSKNYEMGSRI